MLPQNHRELYRKALALSALCADESAASLMTYTILDSWLKTTYPNLITGRGSNDFEQNAAVNAFSKELTKLPFMEAAFWLSCGYATWVGKKARKEKAMFFTPPKLAEHVIDTLMEHGASLENGRWFDPACGGAAFIAPLALRMRVRLIELGRGPDEILDTIQRNIVGIDIDDTLKTLATVFLSAVVYEEMLITKRELAPNITVGDTLSQEIDTLPDFDVLVCNPPYRKLVAADREKILKIYLSDVEGQHNLYAVFMGAALRVARKNALLALLTPTSYISGRQFSKLRTRLTDRMQILQLDMLTERDSTFVQVEQETAILYGKCVDETEPRATPVSVLTAGGGSKKIGKVTLSSDGSAWYVPRSDREFEAFQCGEKTLFRLHDYGYVAKIGPLVWNRDKRKQLFDDEEVKAAKSLVPVIWSSNITADGRFQFGRSSGQAGYFSFVDLDDGTSSGLLRTECVVLQRVTSTDQARRLVAAVVPNTFVKKFGHFIAENHVITLIPTLPRITPEHMRELLMSEQVDLLFRCLSGTVGVTVFELKHLPLPDPRKLVAALRNGAVMADAVAIAYEKSKSITEKEPTHGT